MSTNKKYNITLQEARAFLAQTNRLKFDLNDEYDCLIPCIARFVSKRTREQTRMSYYGHTLDDEERFEIDKRLAQLVSLIPDYRGVFHNSSDDAPEHVPCFVSRDYLCACVDILMTTRRRPHTIVRDLDDMATGPDKAYIEECKRFALVGLAKSKPAPVQESK